MPSEPIPYYPHRHNKDGSFKSICLNCFAIVANRMTEAELIDEEKRHVCLASLLSRRTKLMQEAKHDD